MSDQLSIVMITVDRSPGDNYLHTALEPLRYLGKELIICDSGSSDYVREQVEIGQHNSIKHLDAVCANINVADALFDTVEEDANYHGWVLFLEDDIAVCGDFINSVKRWLADYATTLPIIYPLGANFSGVTTAQLRGQSSWQYPICDFYGTQAFVVRSQHALEIAAYIREHCYDFNTEGTRYDHLIRDWSTSCGMAHFITPVPSFVQHVGCDSVIKSRASASGIHTFLTWPGVEWEYVSATDRKCVAILTPFRNARRHLVKYFEMVAQLRVCIGQPVRIVAAEGDSTDGTREEILRLAGEYGLQLELVPTDHGHMRWGSVEDATRMVCMSNVMNAALSRVVETDICAVWIMCDVVWDSSALADIIKGNMLNEETIDNEPSSVYAPMAMNGDGSAFYDTWAYRHINGARFKADYVLENLNQSNGGSYEIASAGTCLVMPTHIAMNHRATDNEAVSFCAAVRDSGHSIYLLPNCKVYHQGSSHGRLLYVGDIFTTTGLSRCTHSVLPELAALGYEVDVIGIDYHGVPHDLPYRVWPAAMNRGDSACGRDMLYRMLCNTNVSYDKLVILCDVWQYEVYLEVINAAIEVNESVRNIVKIAWVGVDSCNQQARALCEFDQVITWTEFGKSELVKGGCDSAIQVVPLGVDIDQWPIVTRERQVEIRKQVLGDSVPHDAFIVGVVGRNQQRKRIDLSIASFAQLVHVHGVDAWLLLHVGDTKSMGCDIAALVDYYDVKGRVVITGGAVDNVQLHGLYACMDVLLNTSLGEGWSLTTLEAMACGVVCVAPDHSALSEWASDCAICVECVGEETIAPINGAKGPHTIGKVIDVVQCGKALYRVFNNRSLDYNTDIGRQLAEKYNARECAKLFASVVDNASKLGYSDNPDHWPKETQTLFGVTQLSYEDCEKLKAGEAT